MRIYNDYELRGSLATYRKTMAMLISLWVKMRIYNDYELHESLATY